MSTGVVIFWSLVSAAALGVAAWCGSTAVAMGVGTFALLAAILLVWFNRGLLRPGPDGRGWGEILLVASTACLPFAVGLALLLHPVELSTRHRLWVFRGIALTGLAIPVAIYLSSLVDWCYTSPRLRGLGGYTKPCIDSTARHWRTLTQVWLAHRAVAFVAVRGALAVAAAIGVVGVLPHVPPATASLIGATAAVIASYYLNRVVAVFALATHPPMQVGDKIVLAEEYGTGVDQRPSYYVVDVSMVGVQVLELGQQDEPVAPTLQRTHDRAIPLEDIQRLLRARRRFSGCVETCSRANPYCPLERGASTRPPQAPPEEENDN